MPSRKDTVHLVIGKLRREMQGLFQPKLVAGAIAQRVGECKRCTACCRLPFRCPWLIEGGNGNGSRCRWYHFRPTNCRLFPITPKDIEDRNRIMPGKPCGYSFDAKANRE